jgi:hypothetical protein
MSDRDWFGMALEGVMGSIKVFRMWGRDGKEKSIEEDLSLRPCKGGREVDIFE